MVLYVCACMYVYMCMFAYDHVWFANVRICKSICACMVCVFVHVYLTVWCVCFSVCRVPACVSLYVSERQMSVDIYTCMRVYNCVHVRVAYVCECRYEHAHECVHVSAHLCVC